MHILIVGERGVGKSTLIRRVLQELALPVWGFETKKLPATDETPLGAPLYIYPCGAPHIHSDDALLGYCGKKDRTQLTAGFLRFAPHLEQPVPEGHIILMDELGIMESDADRFCEAVLQLLDGNAPIIAAVKHKDTAFLQAVRNHKNCRCFFITPENREALFEEVLSFAKEQLLWQEKH